MSIRNASRVVTFDADAALDAALSVTDGLRICVEYDVEEFNTLYADDVTISLYGGEDAMIEHFEDVHSYVNIDFTERDLFRDVLFAAGTVRAFVTYMDYTTAVRFLDDESGLFLALDPDAPVTETLEAVRDAVGREA